MASTSNFMQGIESLRNVEWSRGYLWDIKFSPRTDKPGTDQSNTAPPAPFDAWFPASDYSETALHSNTLLHSFYMSQYKFPYQTGSTDIQMTIHDDVYGTIYDWLTNWYTSMLNSGDGVAMLDDAWRTLDVMKLDTQHNVLKLQRYYVIPEGSVTETLGSHPDTKMYAVQFAVVGREILMDYASQFNSESSNDSAGTDGSITSPFNTQIL